ncbi:cupin domain-containing protein [Pseudomonas antarctica]|uniref:cupin domain-containing protein n=1 Tax=Pseudomonas antarctica TaxID=219572 RepID=UPI00387B0B22
MSSNLARQGIDARDVYTEVVGGIASLGDTVDLFLIGGLFTYGDDARLLLDGLPPVVRISARSEQAGVLRSSLERLALEYASPRLGAALMTEHLAQMMLVQILRLYQSSLGASTQGWLAALTAPRLAPVLAQVHAEPAREYRERALHNTHSISHKEASDERYPAREDPGQRY